MSHKPSLTASLSSRRRKCQTPTFGTACTYCVDRGLPCTRDTQSIVRPIRPPEVNQNQKILPSAPSIDSVVSPRILPEPYHASGLPPKELCLELARLYIDYIHDQFHSLFHPPSLLQDVEAGRAPPVIVFAIMALSARFSTNPIFADNSPRKRGDEYAKKSTRLLDLRDVSMTTIQACVLLGAFSITCGESAAESIYYCAAARIANLMDLGRKITPDVLEAEVNRRVWWSLCMIDVWSSTGVNLPRQMPALDDLPLPMDDVHFLRLKPGEFMSPSVANSPATGPLLAEMIKLNRILIQINNLNTQTVQCPLSPVELEKRVSTLSHALSSWHNSLPTSMHDTPQNLSHWASLGLGRVFIAVYLGYYHFGQLLFYQFLHGDALSTVLSAKYYAQKCKYFAEALCTIVYASYATPGCDVQYTMVGHILVIASTIQIHTLLFSDNESLIAAARQRLEQNFEILSRLREVWPTLDVSFTRLRAFHKACRDSMDESFRLDVWMLRFLSEFAVVVEERAVGAATPDERVWSLENIGASPLEN